jgi:hypothetical protein
LRLARYLVVLLASLDWALFQNDLLFRSLFYDTGGHCDATARISIETLLGNNRHEEYLLLGSPHVEIQGSRNASGDDIGIAMRPAGVGVRIVIPGIAQLEPVDRLAGDAGAELRVE